MIDLHFYPEPSIDCNVQVYKNALGVVDEDKTLVEIPLKMVESEVNLETTEERREISEDDLISNIEEILYLKSILMGQIQLLLIHPQTNLYFQIISFVTGEQITYRHSGDSSPIGIVTTTIPGVGSTDKLPPTLFVVKDADLSIRVAASATQAYLQVLKFLMSMLLV